MARFYTKKGDDGYTGLLGEGRAPKYDPRIETLGAIDEANAAIGLARVVSQAQETAPILLDVQRDLYHLMAEIASNPENVSQFRELTADRVNWLEGQIEILGKQVHAPEEFIIPGDSMGGAVLDLARTIVRRAESHVAHMLHRKKIENKELLRYLNRLSTLCFVLELLENQAIGKIQPTHAKD